MKKPLNKFALALWVLAASIFAGDVAQVVIVISTITAARGDTIYFVLHNTWTALYVFILAPVQLVALGVIVELIDQIRWNALPK